MRAELPWNVAGIAPEAREAARAQARREGLSVGEWLTRRILRDLSDLAELGDDESAAARRRDTEEILAQLAEAEAEATSSYRRIEQKLRLVGTDYDNAERSQSESNRAMSRAANEIHTAGREQAEAFDQLGRHVSGLDERLGRLERANGQEGLKEAVKGLHQGLSRLASELGQTTGRSGVQIASLARNLEQLALRLVATRGDAEDAVKRLDTRLAVMEEAHHVTADAIDRAVEKLDDEMARRAEMLSEAEAREALRQQALERVEARLTRIEDGAQTHALAERLDEIEQSLSQIVASLERDQTAGLEENLAQLAARLEAVEKNHQGMLLDLSERLSDVAWAQAQQSAVPQSTLAPPSEENEISQEPAPQSLPDGDHPAEEIQAMAPPEPFQEAEDLEDESDGQSAHDFADFTGDFEMPAGLAEALTRPLREIEPEIEPGLRLKTPQEEESLLKAARLSALAASEEDAAGLRIFPWRARAYDAKRPSLAFLAIVLLVLLVGAAAVLLGRQFLEPVKTAIASAAQAVSPPKAPALPKHPAPMAPPAASPAVPDAAAAPAPSSNANAASPAASEQSAAAPSDKMLAMAGSGDAAAQTVIALRYLDGPASDPGKAAPWLEKAAAQGQPVAQYRLGTLYERGQGVGENAALAVKWYRAAAAQGNRKAMHNLAVAYADGLAGPKDMTEAARWFAKAAALGLSDSQFNLAVLYERGDGVPQSLSDAYKWYAIAAAQGDAESKVRLSVLKTQLPAVDRDAAERAAASFRAQALDRVANLPPDAQDAGN